MRHGPGIVTLTALGVAAFGLLTLGTSREALAPALLFDGPSYLTVAEQIRAHWFLRPPSLDLRPPLYPAVIAVAGWVTGSDGLATVRDCQVVAWLMVGPLVTLWVYRVGGSLLIGALTGCLHYTLGESFFNIGLIYAETITVTLAVAAGLALSCSMLPGARSGALRWLAAGLALATAHGRPIYQLLLPLYALFAVAPHVRARASAVACRATPFVVAGLVGLLPFYVVRAVVQGSPAFVNGAGHSLANYLGDRRLLGKFPPEFEAVEALYAARFASDPRTTRIPWWEVANHWPRAGTGQVLRRGALDRSMGITALAVLSRNPGYYVQRWRETWREFSTSASPPVAGRWCPINLANPSWTFYWTYLGEWSPFVILAVEVANVASGGRGKIVRLVPIVTYLTIALANTAIEPWPGQLRYRSQVEIFIVIALGLVVAQVVGWMRAAVRRSSGQEA